MTEGWNGALVPRLSTRDLRTKKSTAERSRANVWFVKSDQGNLIERSQERLAIDFLLGSLDDREKSRQNARHLPPVVIPLVEA